MNWYKPVFMKITTSIIIVIGITLIVFNATKIDISNPFQGESIIALITTLAALCAILLMVILRVSNRINDKAKGKK